MNPAHFPTNELWSAEPQTLFAEARAALQAGAPTAAVLVCRHAIIALTEHYLASPPADSVDPLRTPMGSADPLSRLRQALPHDAARQSVEGIWAALDAGWRGDPNAWVVEADDAELVLWLTRYLLDVLDGFPSPAKRKAVEADRA